MKYPDVRHYIGGRFVDGGPRFLDVHNPADGSTISRVPVGDAGTVELAVAAATRAFAAWSETPIKERVQVFYRYKALLEKHLKELGELITEEHGKIAGEAEAGDSQGDRTDRVRLLAAADRRRRGARGEPRGRVPDRAGRRWASSPRSLRSTSPRWCRTGRFPTRSRWATASSSSRRSWCRSRRRRIAELLTRGGAAGRRLQRGPRRPRRGRGASATIPRSRR